MPLGAYAQSADASSSQSIPLDLTSSDKNVSASSLFQSGSSTAANIDVGGVTQTITSGSMLTPAEYLAVSQVLAGGAQSIQLSNLGTAIGGSFNISAGLSSSLSSLVIPQGVSAYHDFGSNSVLNLAGNFTNSGSYYAFSSNQSVTSSTIAAMNISNLLGANLTSVLPNGGIPGFSTSSLVSALNLNLNAVQNILNQGSISSSGSLSILAGGSIINNSGIAGVTAMMQAVNNINLQAANILNSGTIAAQLGNMNIVTQQLTNNSVMQALAGNINVLNSLSPNSGLSVLQGNSAVMEALNGSINFNVTDSMLKANMDISGGSLLAQELNFNNGDGTLNVNLLDASGAINVNTGIASFAVTEGTHGLNIQSFNITGDPNLVYSGVGPFSSSAFNSLGGYVDIDTSADLVNGSITFTGDINTTPAVSGNGGFVRLNAGTTINTTNIITSANASGNGGKITLVAQGNVTTGDLILSGAGTGANGDIAVAAGMGGAGDFLAGDVTASHTIRGESFSIAAYNGTITTGQVTFYSDIDWSSSGTIQFTGINTSVPSGNGANGNIKLLATGGGDIIATSTGIKANSSGNLIQSGEIQLIASNGDISLTGGMDISSTNGAFGNLVELVGNNITMIDNLPGNSGDINLSSSGTGFNFPGILYIFAENNITLRNIVANTSNTGQGSLHVIQAGNSGIGNISIQNITGTTGVSGNEFSIIAPGVVSIGNVDTHLTSSGCCATLQVQAGTSGTARAPAQSGNLTIGNIN